MVTTIGPSAGALLSSQCHSPYLIGPSIGRMRLIVNGSGEGAGAGAAATVAAGTGSAVSSSQAFGSMSRASSARPAMAIEPSSTTATTVDPPIHFTASFMPAIMPRIVVNDQPADRRVPQGDAREPRV